MECPKILTTISGEKIDSAELWEKYRRNEIKYLFENFIYGAPPKRKPDSISFNQLELINNYKNSGISKSKIEIEFDGYSLEVVRFSKDGEVNLPSFVYIMHEYQQDLWDTDAKLDYSFLPITEITSQGFAIYVMQTSGIYPDFEHKANYEQGIFKLYSPNRKNRSSNDWATISAWAWGASRVMDYIETDKTADKNRVAVVGHSRGGKTALWCAACDERFAYAVSNNSGCSGAAMHRGYTGEKVKDIVRTDWFCENYKIFSDAEDYLPVDQHMLLALMAPRLVYVSSSLDDAWASPHSERESCRLAGEAYELYGKKGVVMPGEEGIVPDTPYHEGMIGYHIQTGPHSITPFDWNQFISFWLKHMK